MLLLLCSVPQVAAGQILDLRELSAEALRSLPRDRTVVIMPGGILEEHGPYLPSYTDGYQNEWFAMRIAEAIVARPGWVALMFPPIPLGVGGFNQVGLRQTFPGTYHVHPSTLRSIYMDLASELGEDGFRYLFIVQLHGAPDHNTALHQAADFFTDTYGGRMAHLSDLVDPTPPTLPPLLPNEAARAENGLDVHSGAIETSRILFIRADLVHPSYQQAQPLTGRTWPELVAISSGREFRGYVGSPRLGSAALGAESMRRAAERYTRLALGIIDGIDPRTLGRASNTALDDPGVRQYTEASREHDRRMQDMQQNWLNANVAGNQ
jgi:creatinine amidohydrolase/Fe(II)-dependent formamide hydrolase-like protein